MLLLNNIFLKKMNQEIEKNQKKPFNVFTNSAVWTAFLVWLIIGGISVPKYLSGTEKDQKVGIIMIIMIVVWEAWIILKKAKKWSFIIGFLLALLADGIAFYLLVIM